MKCIAALAAALLVPALAQAGDLNVTVRDTAGKPVRNAVVSVYPAAGLPAGPIRFPWPMVMSQQNIQFDPAVLVVPVGAEVSFPNRDKVRHHVYSFSPIKPFELKLYIGTPANPVRFDKAGIAVLGCNIHDNMVAWVVVVDTPHHGKTDAEGRVRLDGVTAGAWRLRSWHPGLPPGAPAQEQALAVAAAGNAVAVRLVGVAP